MDPLLTNKVVKFLQELATERLSKRLEIERMKILIDLYETTTDSARPIEREPTQESLDLKSSSTNGEDSENDYVYADVLNASNKVGPLYLKGILTWKQMLVVATKYRLYLYKYKGDTNEKEPEVIINISTSSVKYDPKNGKKFTIVSKTNDRERHEFRGLDAVDIASWVATLKDISRQIKSNTNNSDSDDYEEFKEFLKEKNVGITSPRLKSKSSANAMMNKRDNENSQDHQSSSGGRMNFVYYPSEVSGPDYKYTEYHNGRKDMGDEGSLSQVNQSQEEFMRNAPIQLRNRSRSPVYEQPQ